MTNEFFLLHALLDGLTLRSIGRPIGMGVLVPGNA